MIFIVVPFTVTSESQPYKQEMSRGKYKNWTSFKFHSTCHPNVDGIEINAEKAPHARETPENAHRITFKRSDEKKKTKRKVWSESTNLLFNLGKF